MTNRVTLADVETAARALALETGQTFTIERGSRVNGRRWKAIDARGFCIASAPDARGLVDAIGHYCDGWRACARAIGADSVRVLI